MVTRWRRKPQVQGLRIVSGEVPSGSDARILRLVGSIDLWNAPLLREAIEEEITRTRKKPLLLDFREIRYIDSAGIATLVGGRKAFGNDYENFRLFGLTQPLQEIFSIVKLGGFFRLFTTLEEALAGPAAQESSGTVL